MPEEKVAIITGGSSSIGFERIDVVVNNAGYALVGALKKLQCRK